VWFRGPWTGNRDQRHPSRYIPLVGITARSHLTSDPLDPPRKLHHAALREAKDLLGQMRGCVRRQNPLELRRVGVQRSLPFAVRTSSSSFIPPFFTLLRACERSAAGSQAHQCLPWRLGAGHESRRPLFDLEEGTNGRVPANNNSPRLVAESPSKDPCLR
jgi:hypothetical protein